MTVLELYFPITNDAIYENIIEKHSPNRSDSFLITFKNKYDPKYLFTQEDVLIEIYEQLISRDRKWLEYIDGKVFINLNDLRKTKGVENIDWLNGKIEVKPEIIFKEKNITVQINIREGNLNLVSVSKRIFLSHKTANKDVVREYKMTLDLIGFQPWLDEEDMPAGTIPHRAILQGFKDSFAVVFFITEDFQDNRYLATEIDYAINEKIERGDNFSIITLVLSEEAIVPDPLKSYIYKSPKNDLEGLRDIINALPKK